MDSFTRTASLLLLIAAPFGVCANERTDAQVALADAGSAVEAAARADATHYATSEIESARAMFADAQDAFDHHHWVESVMDAESARVDANLAAARSRQHIAEAATEELDRTLQSLREQLNPTGEQP